MDNLEKTSIKDLYIQYLELMKKFGGTMNNPIGYIGELIVESALSAKIAESSSQADYDNIAQKDIDLNCGISIKKGDKIQVKCRALGDNSEQFGALRKNGDEFNFNFIVCIIFNRETGGLEHAKIIDLNNAIKDKSITLTYKAHDNKFIIMSSDVKGFEGGDITEELQKCYNNMKI